MKKAILTICLCSNLLNALDNDPIDIKELEKFLVEVIDESKTMIDIVEAKSPDNPLSVYYQGKIGGYAEVLYWIHLMKKGEYVLD